MDKDREMLHLEHFKETCAFFPAGEIEPTERPDFIVQTDGRLLGIEHTEVFQTGQPDGESLQAQDHLAQRVVSQASGIYSQDHSQPLLVQVMFHPQHSLRKQEVTRLARTIVDVIEKTPLEVGIPITLRRASGHLMSLPDEIAMIHIYSHPNGNENLWRASSVGFVPELTAENIQDKIDQKEKKLDEYASQCAELWLLIVADDLRIPSVVDLSPLASAHFYHTRFDRVFLFWNATRRYIEFHLAKNA